MNVHFENLTLVLVGSAVSCGIFTIWFDYDGWRDGVSRDVAHNKLLLYMNNQERSNLF